MEGTRQLPFVVTIASFVGFAKAAFLGFMGVIGLLAWNDVTEPWGLGALLLAAIFGLASFALLRGSRLARTVLGGFAVAGGALAIYFAITGPTSAIGPSLVTAAMAAIVLWLLYGTRSAREYFA